jgi:hypothetical protein
LAAARLRISASARSPRTGCNHLVSGLDSSPDFSGKVSALVKTCESKSTKDRIVESSSHTR